MSSNQIRTPKYLMAAAAADTTIAVVSPLDSVHLRDAAIAKRKKRESEEPMLQENPNRHVIFPIQHSDLWKMYKDHVSVFWRPEELDLSRDLKDWMTLSANHRLPIERKAEA